MADLRQTFQGAWAQARAGFSAAEQRAEKAVADLTATARLRPEELRRYASEAAERLKERRQALEKAAADALRRAAARFQLASRDDVQALRQRVEVVTKRVEEMKATTPAEQLEKDRAGA